MVVDSHVHLWDAQHTPQPWMTHEHASIARPFGPDDLEPLLERNGIDAVILVQGACLDSDTDYLFEVAGHYEWVGAVTAWLSLDEPERARVRLDELEAQATFRAVRHLTHHEDEHWLLRPRVLESVAMLEQRGVILEVPVVFPRHFDDVVDLAHGFPELRIVIDHLGKPPIGTSSMTHWEAELRLAAERPNVFAKVSGLNTALDSPDWVAADLFPALAIALDCFGPERLLAGSDWPVALLNGDYDRVWTSTCETIDAAAPGLSGQILGGNAARIYRLDPPVGGMIAAAKEGEWRSR